MHFSKCGAKRDDATGRSQFGHVQSIVFFVFVEPKISISGISTMLNLVKDKQSFSFEKCGDVKKDFSLANYEFLQ